jgi:hypothetical protein
MTTWADKIAALESAGWSLTGLGKAIVLSPQSLSDIKQGRTREPTGMAAVRLHQMFVKETKRAGKTKAA